jgi:hemoglobin
VTNEDTPTLYEWAGGAEALHKLTEAFHHRIRADDLLEPLFRDMDHDHSRYVAAWLGEVFGGPRAYSTTRGGHAHMVARHLGKAITEEQRRRWVALLLDTAELARLPGINRGRCVPANGADIPWMWLGAVTVP